MSKRKDKNTAQMDLFASANETAPETTPTPAPVTETAKASDNFQTVELKAKPDNSGFYIAPETEDETAKDETPAPKPKAKKPRRERKAKAKPETLGTSAPLKVKPTAVLPPSELKWSDNVDGWKHLTEINEHDKVRIEIADWATAHAPDVPEFAMLALDFRMIASRSDNDGYSTEDYLEWRLEDEHEMLERIGKKFGAETESGIRACL